MKLDNIQHVTSSELRKKYLINNSKKIICTVTNFSKHKNIPLMLRSLELLFNKRDDIHFLFIGDSPQRGQYLEYVRSKNILNENILFIGYSNNVYEIFLECDLFLMTSSWEGLPNVIIESMSCGLPVLTTPFDGVNEVVKHGEDGIIVNNHDENEISECIDKLILDERLLDFLGKSALRSSKRFNMDKMVKSYIDLINNELYSQT